MVPLELSNEAIEQHSLSFYQMYVVDLVTSSGEVQFNLVEI